MGGSIRPGASQFILCTHYPEKQQMPRIHTTNTIVKATRYGIRTVIATLLMVYTHDMKSNIYYQYKKSTWCVLLCYESFDYQVIMIGDILIGLLDGLVWCVLARLSQQDHTQMVRKRAKAVQRMGLLTNISLSILPQKISNCCS